MRTTEKESESRAQLFGAPWTVVHGILQVRILGWVAFPFSRASSQPRDQTQVSHIAGGFLPGEPQGKPNRSVGFDDSLCSFCGFLLLFYQFLAGSKHTCVISWVVTVLL